MTVRKVVEHLYRYLRKEQRAIPADDPDLDDPLPEALAAVNGTLQYMAVTAPLFVAKRQRSAFYHAPATVAVTGLINGNLTATGTWPAWSSGCTIALPGETMSNRIILVSGGTATLQFPYLGNLAAGNAVISCDRVALPEDVITVLPPVRTQGGVPLVPANGRQSLVADMLSLSRDDYGRRRKTEYSGIRYFVEADGGSLSLMLGVAPASDFSVEYQARCSLGYFVTSDVTGGTAEVNVAGGFVESIFLPLVMMRWFGSSVMRNVDAPSFVAQQAQAAELLLQKMRPQGQKSARILPTW